MPCISSSGECLFSKARRLTKWIMTRASAPEGLVAICHGRSPIFRASPPGVLSTDDLVDVDASVERVSLWRKPCRATGTQRQQRGEKTSLDFKTTNTRTYLGAQSFTHSDVEYNGNKVSTVGRYGIRKRLRKIQRASFESVRFNRILPSRPDMGGRFLMGPRLQGC